MSKRKIRHSGPLLPRTEESCCGSGQIFDEETRKRGVGYDGCPLLTLQHGENKPAILKRLVAKPEPCLSVKLDVTTRTMPIMDAFAEKVRDRQGWLEIRFKRPIEIHKGRVPAFEIIGIMVSNVITNLIPQGLLSMTNLRQRDSINDDGKYWNFVKFIAKELGEVWRDIPLQAGFYFEFKDQYVLRAKDHEEVDTMQVGRAGSYRIVGMVVKRLR